MASVPAEVNPEAQVPETEETSMNIGGDPQNDMLLGFNKLTLMRQIGLMVGLAASVALGLAVVLWAQEPNYQPLLTNLHNYDPDEITTLLNDNGINYKIEPKTGILMVETDDIYTARLKLASAGVKEDTGIGYEIMDQDQSLGSSQFMETTRFKRGLEGELARTISSLRNVRTARVHLAVPKRSVFVRDVRKPSASVFVEVYAGRELTKENVSSIVNLVASSVPEMSDKDVTVVDQRGNLLSKNDEDAEAKEIAKEFEYSRKVESVLNSRVVSILEPIIGAGRFRSEVSADVDFTEIESAEEVFNPDLQALRSEQTVDEQRVNGADGGVPGALSNQPPGNATAPELANGQPGAANPQMADIRKQATRNYEVDRSVSYTRHQTGKVARLTVAVVVDDIKRIDPESGDLSYVPWPAAELERLTILVRNAVGYSAARGDSVTVINSPFAPEEVVPVEEIPLWQQAWVLEWIKPFIAFLVFVILLFGLVRPTLKSLAKSGEAEKELALAGDEEGLATLDELEDTDAMSKVTLSATDEFLLPGASEGYDKQLNALKGLVAEDPARVAQVIRQWVNADE
ncbi:MAG: flagellar M-ring protein FliF [Pseudomonadales bacterium]|uniref:Flagellar M-ring protein n=1 Tax=Oleiphilus messinensis TaxID=141451 RepID=A0A1Y0IBF4_9GAMM|nr:flagellar basal-body MS-ring/collar protein FliF [Oleiphilus messinensis]ARU57590.1 flagellar MS-ring protein [Oleiphilus messinensis]MCG8612441.1 flagellar M-ring protein FliF [Pseudomonadales bacterium]